MFDLGLLRNLKFHYRLSIVAAFLCFPIFGLNGCTSVETVSNPDLACIVASGKEASGLISVFLNLKRPEGAELNVEITSIEISRGGVWLPVSFNARGINTKNIGSRQISLGQSPLPSASYDKVRLTISPEATLVSNKQKIDLVVTETQVEIPFKETFDLAAETSESLFLSWDVEASLSGDFLKPPVVDLATSRSSPITANQIYVACPDINTIYGIRADRKWVNRSFFVGGRPTYIAIDNKTQKLYVLCEEDGDIKVIDLVKNVLTDVINLPMTFRPIFMEFVSEQDLAYVIDDLGNISRVDLQTGNVTARKKIGRYLNYVEYMASPQAIAVSAGKDNLVYLLDPQSLEIKTQIPVSGAPSGLLHKDEFLYIAEKYADSITIFDNSRLNKFKTLFVGFAPRRLVDLENNIYVANSDGGSLSFLRAQNQRVTKKIQVGHSVFEMAPSIQEQLVYIGKKDKDDCGGSIGYLDVTTNTVIGEIEIGSKPMGIVIGE